MKHVVRHDGTFREAQQQLGDNISVAVPILIISLSISIRIHIIVLLICLWALLGQALPLPLSDFVNSS